MFKTHAYLYVKGIWYSQIIHFFIWQTYSHLVDICRQDKSLVEGLKMSKWRGLIMKIKKKMNKKIYCTVQHPRRCDPDFSRWRRECDSWSRIFANWQIEVGWILIPQVIRLILPGNLSRGSRCIANFLPGKRTRSNVISSCRKRPYKIFHKLWYEIIWITWKISLRISGRRPTFF